MIGVIAVFFAGVLAGAFLTPDGRLFIKLAVATVIAFSVDGINRVKRWFS